MASIFFTSDYQPAVRLHPGPAASCVLLDLTALPAGTYRVCLLGKGGQAATVRPLAGGRTHCLNLRGVAGPSYGVLVSRDGSGEFMLLHGRLPAAQVPPVASRHR